MTRNIKLVEGQKFNHLTVIKLDHIEDRIYNSKYEKSGKRTLHLEFYLCKCDCGKETIVEKSHLRKKVDATESCGCIMGTHHMSHKNRIYDIWTGMRKRCYSDKQDDADYNNYKARGIKMCHAWKNDFMSFYNWAISNGYRDDLTIDRINNNGNYEPSNCRWADRKTQNNNKRNNIFIDYCGEKIALAALAKRLNMKYNTLYMKYKRGGTSLWLHTL